MAEQFDPSRPPLDASGITDPNFQPNVFTPRHIKKALDMTNREISQQSFSNLLKSKDRDTPSTTMYGRTNRGQSKQLSSNSLETKEKHRYTPHQYDKASGRYFSREESKTNMRYLRSSLQNGKRMFQAASPEQNQTQINSKPRKILEEPAESSVKEVDGKFSLKEELKTYTGYLRPSPKIDKAGGRFSNDDSSSYTGYLQPASKTNRVENKLQQ
ncbi:uncharacterized protein LOC144509520 [Mustelus asterias]